MSPTGNCTTPSPGTAEGATDGRLYNSLNEVRRVSGRWRELYAIPAQHVHKSDIDLDILRAQMDLDLEGAVESRNARFIS